jgi:hypothetical protein
MKKHYQSYYGVVDKDETDLPASEYFRFLKFWDITVIFSDILTLYGTVWIVFNTVVCIMYDIFHLFIMLHVL